MKRKPLSVGAFTVTSCCKALMLAALALLVAKAQAENVSRDVMQEFIKLGVEVHTAFEAKEYDKAIQICHKQLELIPNTADPHYNLACAYARQSKKDEALAELAKAVEAGFTDAAHMCEDDDLGPLRKERQFEELAAKAEARRKSDLEKFYDKAGDIAGVKTVEGRPAGGLWWRLRMSPAATPEKPNRLIVWLHPSGGSMNKQAENFSAEFNKRGFALLVPTMKQWMNWSGPELAALMNLTVPDAAKTPGIDPHKPVLMGFSAGGQGALIIYKENPANLGGLILDAAYPIEYQQGRPAAWNLPQGEENLAPFKKVPFFVLVGAQDGGARLWQDAEKHWGARGVPLTLTIVPGQGHAWLFGKRETDALYTWLEQVGKGDLPGGKSAENQKR
ncbi:MAG: tetratricopeptide repeat protein [Planctomycetota bacterium]